LSKFAVLLETGAQPALHFGGGAIITKFYSMSPPCLFKRGITFRKRSQVNFSSQHFRKW